MQMRIDMQPIATKEAELLKRMSNGDEAAFTELYHAHSERLYLNILQLIKDERLAEEMVQEIFTRIWQKRVNIHIEGNFAAYLAQTGRNCVLDFYRKLKRDKKLLAHFSKVATSQYGNLNHDLDSRERRLHLQNVINRLPGQQRKAYQLCKQEGLSYQEAAGNMGISPYTVKEYLENAREYLKKYISYPP